MNVFEWLTALSPIVLTAVATYILIKQYSLDKRKFKLEHFNIKYELLKKIRNYLLLIISNAKIDTKELFDLKRDTSDVKTFFDDDIVDFLDDIYSEAVRLRYCNKMIESNTLRHEKYIIFVEEESKILTWLGDQVSICEDLFIKYLKV